MDTKIVNLDVRAPIRCSKHTISIGTYFNAELSIADIFKCICGRAIVDEVLPNGSTIRLNFNNYNKDNTIGLIKNTKKQNPATKEDKKVAEPVVVKVEEEKKEETVVVEPETKIEEPVVEDPAPATVKEEDVIPEETKSEEVVEEKEEKEPVVEDPATVKEESVTEEVSKPQPKNNNTTKKPNKKK